MVYDSVHKGVRSTKSPYPKGIKSNAHLHILYVIQFNITCIWVYTPIFPQGAAYLFLATTILHAFRKDSEKCFHKIKDTNYPGAR
jgi:hypothetical protein